ncbi:MAG: hypothetical protein IIC75_08835, partial [Bacteroidetes bacterium]|nr:hypothetical protein [Bacteroidota bacterium]
MFFLLISATTFAQTTYYVNNSAVGNDGRNGLSATIPSPDDGVTGPKKTIGGAQGALSAAVAGDVIVVASTGIIYNAATGEPNPIDVTKKITFQSTGGTPDIGVVFKVNTGALANKVTFSSGSFTMSGGLTLTAGELVNSSGLITVKATTIIVVAIVTTTKVTGQLLYSGSVNFNYTAVYTTADEYPNSGTIGNFTTAGVAVTLKTSTVTISEAVLTTGSTLNLGGNTLSLATSTANRIHAIGGNVTNGTLAFSATGNTARTHTVNGAFAVPTVTVTGSGTNPHILALTGLTAITG